MIGRLLGVFALLFVLMAFASPTWGLTGVAVFGLVFAVAGLILFTMLHSAFTGAGK